MKQDVYQTITNQILDTMEQGTGPWEMPWYQANAMPLNVESGKPYRGVNILSLWCASLKKGYSIGYWGTFNQWKTKDASVRKGEKASPVVLYKPIERKETNPKTGEQEMAATFIARLYWVFNADQVDGWKAPALQCTGTTKTIQNAERFFANTKARLVHNGERAFYSPLQNQITMPEKSCFIDTTHSTATENYYSTLFHELVHWTEHDDRLNRNLTTRFAKDSRAMEELIAELGAAFLCAQLGVSPAPREDHSAYLTNWLQALKNDKRAIFTASSKASKAVEFLNGLQPENQQEAV